MKSGGSKRKGSAFESEVAKILARWYYDDENALAKTPSSGAMGTVRGKNFKEQCDVRQVAHFDKPWPYSVECKFHADIVIDPFLFDNRRTKLFHFWKQCLRDAENEEKIPLLIFKKNRGDIYICTRAPRQKEELIHSCVHYILTKNYLLTFLNNYITCSYMSKIIERDFKND